MAESGDIIKRTRAQLAAGVEVLPAADVRELLQAYDDAERQRAALQQDLAECRADYSVLQQLHQALRATMRGERTGPS
jgi:hypothetical protein